MFVGNVLVRFSKVVSIPAKLLGVLIAKSIMLLNQSPLCSCLIWPQQARLARPQRATRHRYWPARSGRVRPRLTALSVKAAVLMVVSGSTGHLAHLSPEVASGKHSADNGLQLFPPFTRESASRFAKSS